MRVCVVAADMVPPLNSEKIPFQRILVEKKGKRQWDKFCSTDLFASESISASLVKNDKAAID
jgi:hypothetical protein